MKPMKKKILEEIGASYSTPTRSCTPPPAAVAPSKLGIPRFIVDTGCGYNLVPAACLKDGRGRKSVRKLKQPIILNTAAGPTTTTDAVWLSCPGIDESECKALVLDSTPAVISVGERCQDHGYSFIWEAWSGAPYLLSPTKRRIDLLVEGKIPYLVADDTAAAAAVVTSMPVTERGDAANDTLVGGTPPAMEPKRANDTLVGAPGEGEADDAIDTLEGGIPDTPEEAKSLRHLLTHLPKSRFCPACIRAKMQKKQARRRAIGNPQTEAVNFGDECTCDHWICNNELSKGITGETVALAFKDMATGWISADPLTAKSADRARNALEAKRAPGETYRYFYTDGAPELRKALLDMGVRHDEALPGRPTNNARAERCVKHILEGARTLLEHAGLPVPLWPYAAKYFALCCNARGYNGEKSAWVKRCGAECGLHLLPFGSVVDFLPSAVNPRDKAKLATKTVPGVFLGYVQSVGDRYTGQIYAASLREFDTIHFLEARRSSDGGRIYVDRTAEYTWDHQSPWVFPTKEAHDAFVRRSRPLWADASEEQPFRLEQHEPDGGDARTDSFEVGAPPYTRRKGGRR